MMIYKKIVLILTCVLLAQLARAQMKQVKFEQLDSLQKIESRPVVIFFHTSWCKYCSSMKHTTFKNDKVIQLLNEKFYFVSFNVEEREDILFRGSLFKYKPTGANTGVHELAEQLGSINGELAYPGICFLNTKNEILYQGEGYISPKDFLFILTRLKNAVD